MILENIHFIDQAYKYQQKIRNASSLSLFSIDVHA